ISPPRMSDVQRSRRTPTEPQPSTGFATAGSRRLAGSSFSPAASNAPAGTGTPRRISQSAVACLFAAIATQAGGGDSNRPPTDSTRRQRSRSIPLLSGAMSRVQSAAAASRKKASDSASALLTQCVVTSEGSDNDGYSLASPVVQT